jgi:hypothetical protein
MTRPDTDTLIDTLTRELQPVGRLRAPAMRALLWLALVGGVGVVMAIFADTAALAHRMAIAPDMWVSVMGAALTAITACIAAFQLSLPDRETRWAWLPLPPALLWIGASGAGCLRTLAQGENGTIGHSLECLVFVVLVSAPLSAVLIVMLRRGYALRPGLVAVMGGLAAAAAAAVLLNFFHPFDAVATDLLVHAVTIGLVVAGNWAFGGQILDTRQPRPFASAK